MNCIFPNYIISNKLIQLKQLISSNELTVFILGVLKHKYNGEEYIRLYKEDDKICQVSNSIIPEY